MSTQINYLLGKVIIVLNIIGIIFFRIVNMLDMTLLDQNNIWKIVRQTRKEFLYQQPELECLNQNILLADSKIDENINTLAEKLKVNTTSTPKDSVSDEILHN